MEMIETITKQALPDELIYTCEANKLWNKVVSRFTEKDSEKTVWSFETDFQCHGLIRISG